MSGTVDHNILVKIHLFLSVVGYTTTWLVLFLYSEIITRTRMLAMMKLETLLSQYAAYHLDHKNILTHFVGIPLIVFSIICLTARAGVMISDSRNDVGIGHYGIKHFVLSEA